MRNCKIKINSIFLLLSLTSLTICMDQPHNSEKKEAWSLFEIIPHTDRLTAAYFGNSGKSLATSTGEKQFIFNVTTKERLQEFSGTVDAIICLHYSEKILGVSLTNPDTKDPKMLTVIYSQLGQGINNINSPNLDSKSSLEILTHFFSDWPIAPHLIDDKAQQVIIAHAQAGTLIVYDLYKQQNNAIFDYKSKIESACFHPFKNIVVSITSRHDNMMHGFDVGAQKELFCLEFENTPSSIRFDETGKRLVLVNEAHVDIFDVHNLCKPSLFLRIANDKQILQACLRGTSLAAASKTNLYLFSTDKKSDEFASFPNNDTYALMDCFDAEGNLLVVLDYKNARIYKRNNETQGWIHFIKNLFCSLQ